MLARLCTLKVSEIVDSLEFGDLIAVEWLDASEAAGRLEDARWDTPVQSVGYFLALRVAKQGMLLSPRRL